jgi:hypothetical protein
MFGLRDALLALALCGVAAAQGAADGAEVPTRELLARDGCQTSLPGVVEGEAGEAAARRSGARSRPRESFDSRFDFGLGGGAAFAEVLLWLAVVVAVVMLVAAIARSRLGGDAPGRAGPALVRGAARSDDAAASAAASELPDHEVLAAAGDFRGAVHALLRRAIDAWNDRGGALPQHATAREALRRAQRVLAAEPLGRLVAVVERVHFGGHPADRDLYEASREQLRAWEHLCRPQP